MRVVRVPRPEMQHSRLHTSASQERHSVASSSDQTCPGPWSTRSATSRPSITSPSRPIVGRASGLSRTRLTLAGSGLTRGEPVGPVQPDEVGRCDAPPALQAGGRALEQDDLVVPTRAYWLHESPARYELLHQRRRNACKSGGDQDGVERGSDRQPTASVRDQDFEARNALRGEVVPGRPGQVGEALHADHLAREPGQQGGLEAVARADLEDALPSLELQRLEHPGHQRRLGGDLAMRDLDRLVAIGAIRTRGGHKGRAGYRADRLEHARVPHTGGTNQTRQVPRPGGGRRRAESPLHGSEGYAGSAAEPRALAFSDRRSGSDPDRHVEPAVPGRGIPCQSSSWDRCSATSESTPQPSGWRRMRPARSKCLGTPSARSQSRATITRSCASGTWRRGKSFPTTCGSTAAGYGRRRTTPSPSPRYGRSTAAGRSRSRSARVGSRCHIGLPTRWPRTSTPTGGSSTRSSPWRESSLGGSARTGPTCC